MNRPFGLYSDLRPVEIEAILKAAPSDRVRVAVIGCGGQGKHHVSSILSLADHNVELVAVCDVDQSRLAEAKKMAPKAEAVSDLRRVLDNPQIDAVTIATPDHWHAPITIAAPVSFLMYCEPER